MMQIHAIQKLPKSFSLTDFANNRKIRYHQGSTAAVLSSRGLGARFSRAAPIDWFCQLELTVGMDSIGVL